MDEVMIKLLEKYTNNREIDNSDLSSLIELSMGGLIRMGYKFDPHTFLVTRTAIITPMGYGMLK